MKKLDFVCPICGGRLMVCCFETGSTDYIISKKGKKYKNPIRRASTNLDSIEQRLISCENVSNRTCDFATIRYSKRMKMGNPSHLLLMRASSRWVVLYMFFLVPILYCASSKAPRIKPYLASMMAVSESSPVSSSTRRTAWSRTSLI